MKKLLFISLLLLLFFNQIGFQFLYWIEQIIIKKEQKELLISLIPDQNFERIEDNQNIHWEEEGKEFRYNNQMYDVAKIVMIKGKKVYLVLNDSKENDLIKKLGSTALNVKENDTNKGGHTSLLKFIQSVFILKTDLTVFIQTKDQCSFEIFNETFHLDFLKKILIPPPQFC